MTSTAPAGILPEVQRRNSNFRCKHLLAIMQCIPSGEFETAEYLEKRKPKLDERFITTIEGRDFVYYSGLLDLGPSEGTHQAQCGDPSIPFEGERQHRHLQSSGRDFIRKRILGHRGCQS